jgi:hypothetical protein
MPTKELLPNLTLDTELYEAAAATVAAHAPQYITLTWENYTDPIRWWLVPDDHGDAYKAEFELLKTRDKTLKINIWYLPDLRGGDLDKPHSHPWDFDAHIFGGGYDEDRWTLDNAGVLHAERGIEYRAGDTNTVTRDVYHQVRAVHEPGRTGTLMVCGPGQRGGWGYLDLATRRHVPVGPDPDFSAKLAALNPQHQR